MQRNSFNTKAKPPLLEGDKIQKSMQRLYLLIFLLELNCFTKKPKFQTESAEKFLKIHCWKFRSWWRNFGQRSWMCPCWQLRVVSLNVNLTNCRLLLWAWQLLRPAHGCGLESVMRETSGLAELGGESGCRAEREPGEEQQRGKLRAPKSCGQPGPEWDGPREECSSAGESVQRGLPAL